MLYLSYFIKMDYIDYINQKKKLYDSLITYLEDYEQPYEEVKDPNLLRNDDQNLEFLDVILNDSKEEEIEQLLNLMSIISNMLANSVIYRLLKCY